MLICFNGYFHPPYHRMNSMSFGILCALYQNAFLTQSLTLLNRLLGSVSPLNSLNSASAVMRFLGLCCNSFSINRLLFFEICGLIRLGAMYSPRSILMRVSVSVLPSKGSCPVSISYSITPKAQQSDCTLPLP